MRVAFYVEYIYNMVIIILSMSLWRHLKAVALLPVMVTVVIPLILLFFTESYQVYPITYTSVVIGSFLIVAGFLLLYRSTLLVAVMGQGTLAPWDPPSHFVVAGGYQYVRNPMILGVLIMLLGEAIASGPVLLVTWFILFWIGNHIHFIRTEEPDLIQRFGEEYNRYMEHVPRWIPRLKPWSPDSEFPGR
jgi:protein-S-isoprenylcysteine O-methyltransferase Ste14